MSGADCECGIPENSGTISWNLEVELSYYSNATLSVHAWIVESYADYADGGNGQGTYPDVVRKIIDGNDKNGTATITLPEPHDGDDLEVHLMYVLKLPQKWLRKTQMMKRPWVCACKCYVSSCYCCGCTI